ncbi:GntR family transcriptional regulator [Mesorhizobium sp. CAU 1741]|uniref:GntR family transcriptional regulator n=1 Tax=Mesorhizobium sp. CAU 1741 TaxID=3140366 RepID=UPI00325AC3B2
MANALGATDRIAEEIMARIRDGDYVPGQRLVEAGLAQEFEVSRGVIRQTLHRLSAAGIVDIELHRGATIHRLSRRELGQMYEIRQLLEGHAARAVAAAEDHPAIAAELRRLLDQMAPAVESTDVRAFTTVNAAFHDLILTRARNEYLSRVLRQMHAQLPRLIYSRLVNPGTMHASHKGHCRIVEAISAGDGDAAERAMREHVAESGRAMMELPDKFFSRDPVGGT